MKVIVSVILLGIFVRQAMGTPQVQTLWSQPKRWEWMLAALALMSTGYIVSFLRWWLLTLGAKLQLTPLAAIRVGFMSLPFQLISVGVAGGDLLRIYLICRDHPGYRTRAAATVVLDRAIGLLTMFSAVAVVGLFVDWQLLRRSNEPRTLALQSLWWLATVLAIVGLASGLLGIASGKSHFIPQLVARLPGKRLRHSVTNLWELVPCYREQLGILSSSFCLSLINVLCLSGCLYCVAQSLTPESPSLSQHLIIAPLSLIAGAAPLPGGLGSQELLLSWLYAAFSAPDKNTDFGFLVAIGFRVLSLILTAVGLAIYIRVGYSPSGRNAAA